MKTLNINVGKGHIVCTDSQIVVWLYTVYGGVAYVRRAMINVRAGLGLPPVLLPRKNTHAARLALAQSISLCAAKHEGKTGRWLGSPVTAANWSVGASL